MSARARAAFVDSVPVLRVASVAPSAAWYAEVLGFAVDAAGPPGDPVFAILPRDGVEWMLQRVGPGWRRPGPPRAAAEGGTPTFEWTMPRRRGRRSERTRRTSVRSRIGSDGCREFTLSDPDGHVLVFGECGSEARRGLAARPGRDRRV